MKRVVVTGGASPIGRQIVERLQRDPGIETVRGVETGARDDGGLCDDVDVVPLVPDHRPFVEYLEKEQIDTVVQCGLTPDRCGRHSRSGEADVITTMCLGTAIAHGSTGVRSWVLLSSTSIYPIGSKSSLLQREDQDLKFEELEARASIAEAEDYARDVAIRNPHINVSILRFQQLIGRGMTGPLSELLSREVVPTPIGFDPSIQLLHAEDAVDAAAFAAIHELAGVYNVASTGAVHWHDAVRIADRQSVPVLPVSLSLLEPALRLLRIPFVPSELFDLLRFGHAVDTQKIERVGWHPKRDQHECLKSIT
jgi:UDP-glucose 4-epimerase